MLDRIAVPALVLLAGNDPFIRLIPETRERILDNPHIDFIEPRHGGHCAFLSRRTRTGARTGDRVGSVNDVRAEDGVRTGDGLRSEDGVHWAEAMVVCYLQAVA